MQKYLLEQMPSSWFVTKWLFVLISNEILFVIPQLAMNTGLLKAEEEWLHFLPLFLLASSMSQLLQQTIQFGWKKIIQAKQMKGRLCVVGESGELREGQAV